jgi:hypothetical protein
VQCQLLHLLLYLGLLYGQLSVHLAVGASGFSGIALFREAGACCRSVQPGRSHVMSSHGHGVVSHGRGDVDKSTVPSDNTGLYRTVLGCIDRTDYDSRPAVSCRSLFMSCGLLTQWQGRGALPQPAAPPTIGTQRTPRAPAYCRRGGKKKKNFVIQGPSMT